jgi:hypothetical protein
MKLAERIGIATLALILIGMAIYLPNGPDKPWAMMIPTVPLLLLALIAEKKMKSKYGSWNGFIRAKRQDIKIFFNHKLKKVCK